MPGLISGLKVGHNLSLFFLSDCLVASRLFIVYIVYGVRLFLSYSIDQNSFLLPFLSFSVFKGSLNITRLQKYFRSGPGLYLTTLSVSVNNRIPKYLNFKHLKPSETLKFYDQQEHTNTRNHVNCNREKGEIVIITVNRWPLLSLNEFEVATQQILCRPDRLPVVNQFVSSSFLSFVFIQLQQLMRFVRLKPDSSSTQLMRTNCINELQSL